MNEDEIRDVLFEGEAPDPAFVKALAVRTGAVVRRRALHRRLSVIGAVVLAYAGGALTVVAASARQRVPEGLAASVEPVAPAGAPAAPRPTTDRDALARAFRERGDRLLNVEGDVAAALSAYGQHLELAGGRHKVPAGPDDTWLLAALKNRTR